MSEKNARLVVFPNEPTDEVKRLSYSSDLELGAVPAVPPDIWAEVEAEFGPDAHAAVVEAHALLSKQLPKKLESLKTAVARAELADRLSKKLLDWGLEWVPVSVVDTIAWNLTPKILLPPVNLYIGMNFEVSEEVAEPTEPADPEN